MATVKQLKAYKRIRGRKLQAIRADYFLHNPLCEHCKLKGRYTLATELDHILPLFKGGKDTPSNYQGLCNDCHKAKTAADNSYKPKIKIGLDGYPIEPA